MNALDWGMDIQNGIDAPRIGSRNGPTKLDRMGHSVRIRDEASG